MLAEMWPSGVPLGGSGGCRACEDTLENLALDLGPQGVARGRKRAIQFGLE